MLILHITRREDWEKALSKGEYKPESFTIKGFVNCAIPDQIIKIANANFKNKTGLILLCIDSDKVESKIRFESGGYEFYPHIYGVLNLDAVVKTCEFEPGLDGNFTLPSEIKDLIKSYT